MKKILILISVILLVTILTATLVACVPQSYDRAVKKMEKAKYTVSPFHSMFEDAKAGFSAIDENGEYLTATLFNTREAANKAYRACLNVPQIYNLTLNGKWVYHGSANATEVFK